MLVQPFFHLRVALTVLLAVAACVSSGQESTSETISYALRHRSAAEVAAVFRPLVSGASDVDLRLDESRDRIILAGPPWTHELLETVLQRMDGKSAEVPPVANTPSTPPTPATNATPATNTMRSAETNPEVQLSVPRGSAESTTPSSMARRLLPLPRGRAAIVRRDLLALFDSRLQTGDDASQPWSLQTPSGPLRIQLDLTREDILVDGPAEAVDQFAQLLTAVIETQTSETNQQRVLMLPRNVHHHVQSIFRASREASNQQEAVRSPTGNRTATTRPPFRFAGQNQTPVPQVPDASDNRDPTSELGQQDETAPDSNGQPPSRDAILPQLEGIELETLPELDAIILRGRDKDLDELAEVIRQLENLRRETQPAIEIIGLKFSQAERIAEIIEETQENLIGTRQGRAQVVPLGKPNALLIVGWGEAVKALQELIAKLDRPVQPETQFNIFPLRHANAATLQETLQDFFDGRPTGMEPMIQSTVDDRTNSVVVHAAPRDMAEISRLIERLDTPKSRTVQQTRMFPIRNSIAADVAETLEQAIADPTGGQSGTTMELLIEDETRREMIVSGILENIQVTVNARKNSLIISAPSENFELIEALVRQLDQVGTVATIKIFPVQNGDAASLVETLRALLPSQPGAPAVLPTDAAQLASAPGEASLAPLRFTVDVRSNSIIATGSEGDLRIVEALVMRLDESDAMQRRNSVYQLKNSPAVDVALAINEFLRSTRQVEAAAPGTGNPFQQLEKEVVVVPEPVSNKLVLSATPRYFDEIEALIEKLDEQPPQVMIQVLIAEVTLGNTDEFGVELGIQDSVLFDRSLLGDLVTLTNTTQTSTPAGILSETEQVIVGATNQPGFDFNNQVLGNSGSERALSNAGDVGGQGLSNFNVGRTNAELGFGGLVLSASSQNVNVLLRALQESRRMQVLSRPQVLTLDNQPAYIQVGQRVPRIVGSTINQIGQQNQLALENVGLILGVTPRISPEGNVVMEIDAEKSSIGPDIEGIPVSVSVDGTVIRSPRIDVASAQATVSAADGETIILGGLITNSKEELHRKVPYLGDVPVLKHLFRFDSVSERRTELLIILTPHVIRSVEDAERMKQLETARMSWCAADVFDLHGEVLKNPEITTLMAEEDAGQVIYPHVDPRGNAFQNESIEGSPSPPPSVLEPVQPGDDFGLNVPEQLPKPPGDGFSLPQEGSPEQEMQSRGAELRRREPNIGSSP